MKAFENIKVHSKILYLFIFSLAGLFLAGSFVMLASQVWGNQFMLSAWGLRISSAIQMALMFFLPAYTLIVWSNRNPIDYLNLNTNQIIVYQSLYAIIILAISTPFISLLTQWNESMVLPHWLNGLETWMRNLEDSAEETTNLLLSGRAISDYLGNLFFIAVIAAIAEEVFFRGVLQKLLIKLFKNRHAGIWLTAFIFSMMHLQFYGLLPRIALGALLGYLYVQSNTLWVPIIVHFMNNALVVTFHFFFRDSSLYQTLDNPSITFNFVVIALVSAGITIFLLSNFQKKNVSTTEGRVDE